MKHVDSILLLWLGVVFGTWAQTKQAGGHSLQIVKTEA
jgi:hypothetical protein